MNKTTAMPPSTPPNKDAGPAASGKNETYQCAMCGGTFDKVQDDEWSDAKAKEEHDRDFPGESLETSCVICDDCYKIICPHQN
jgi:hypothetical protein